MIKMREARYCNIKLLLIFLVIYGHLIEPQINQSIIVSMQYKLIYLFHMPAFAFLSGLFIKDCRFCTMQLKKIVLLYAGLQILMFICSGGTIDLRYPCWILWYLLSLSCWYCFMLVWLKFAKGKYKITILILSIIIGCFIGYVSCIDRRFSLSRTLVFFPYFWLGAISNHKTDWRKYRFQGIAALFISIIIFILSNKQLTASFLYHATPYGTMKNGAILRLVCYVIGVSVMIFLLAWIPDRRFIFTKAGTDTMLAYILHVPFAVLLRELYFPWYIYLVITSVFLWMLCRVTQLKGTIYRITTLLDRRDEHCPLFKKYIKKMRENYMDSCFPSPETKF